MIPRTINLPSDLIETQALSLARTVTSNDCAMVESALPAAQAGFATGEFKSTEAAVVELDCISVLGSAAVVVPRDSIFGAPESGWVEVAADVAGFASTGAAAAGVVTALNE